MSGDDMGRVVDQINRAMRERRGAPPPPEPGMTEDILAGLADQIDAKPNRIRMVNGSVAVAICFDSEEKRAEVVARLRSSTGADERVIEAAHAAASDIAFHLSGGIVAKETWRAHVEDLRRPATGETSDG